MGLDMPPLASLSGDEAHIDRVELDPLSYKAHRLTPAERQQFEDDGVSRDVHCSCTGCIHCLRMRGSCQLYSGPAASLTVTSGNAMQYVVVRDALSASDACSLHAALDDIHAVKLAEDATRPDPAHRDIPHRMAIFSTANSLGTNPTVLELIRNSYILPKVVDILGWNISLYHAHANITPGPDANGLVVDGQGRATSQLAQQPPRGQEKTFGWHQDTSRVNIEMDAHPGPRLSVKVAYFLTDLTSDSQVSDSVKWQLPLCSFCS